MTYTELLDAPIGTLMVECNEEAVTHIALPGYNGDGAPATGRAARSVTGRGGTPPTGSDAGCGRSDVMERAITQLSEYFAGSRTEFDLPLELVGTDFQKDVWLSLAHIPYGKTISYAELASMVGRPTAFRAVGQANGSNPIPIVLPCHRVVATGGGIGGYGGGLPMKRQLLSLEGVADYA